MAKIVKEFYENYPAMKFVGEVFRNNASPNFSEKWIAAFQSGFFKPLEVLQQVPGVDNGYIGLMKWENQHPEGFEYWIGVFTTLEEKVPDGYDSIVVPASKALSFFLKGKDDINLYHLEGECHNIMMQKKDDYFMDENNQGYCYERYNSPRFTNPNENGEVILDYISYIK